ncbi:reverse transcriptase-like protein, partial [Candidatus Saccharibacteria bacterium]|nr:reverse transcriptase-like protein [Candidatus Saccharibacteria bacterium]NIV12037.1 reverse transcriptase-like protein [Fodinibius sp.]NIV97855.1 reverse transcriptase-like protein [Candidatus Saccharibacteria bacterium]NIX00698.1 reverse transcriptase-like protein [Phycisphaerae bacterium]
LGKYKVKNEGLKPLFKKAKILSRSFRKFSICHVPREQNTHADKLSKMGAEGKEKDTSPEASSASNPTDSEGQGSLF